MRSGKCKLAACLSFMWIWRVNGHRYSDAADGFDSTRAPLSILINREHRCLLFFFFWIVCVCVCMLSAYLSTVNGRMILAYRIGKCGKPLANELMINSWWSLKLSIWLTWWQRCWSLLDYHYFVMSEVADFHIKSCVVSFYYVHQTIYSYASEPIRLSRRESCDEPMEPLSSSPLVSSSPDMRVQTIRILCKTLDSSPSELLKRFSLSLSIAVPPCDNLVRLLAAGFFFISFTWITQFRLVNVLVSSPQLPANGMREKMKYDTTKESFIGEKMREKARFNTHTFNAQTYAFADTHRISAQAAVETKWMRKNAMKTNR